MTVLDWPDDTLAPTAENWHLAGRTLGSAGIFGPGTVVHVENRVWRVDIPLAPLPEARWRPLRALLDEARGRYGVLRIRVQGGPDGATGIGSAAFADATPFDGDVLFAPESLADLRLAQPAAAGATQIALAGPAVLLAPAAMISLPNDRLHRVAARAGATVTLNPPLREAVPAGAPVEAMAPRARMRLDTDEAALTRRPGNHTAPATLALVEAL